MPVDSERKYVYLLFRASQKYELCRGLGAESRVDAHHSLGGILASAAQNILEGNNYKEARKYEIPPPKEQVADLSHRVTWITSQNVQDLSVSGSLGG